MPAPLNRRTFALRGFACAWSSLSGQTTGPGLARTDVAKLDGVRILAEAQRNVSVALPATPLTRRADLQAACRRVANLTAAWLVSHEAAYATAASALLLRLCGGKVPLLSPRPVVADPTPSAALPAPGVLTIADLAPLAELMRATSFLADTESWSPVLAETMNTWRETLADWLTTERNPVLARDTKDHNASAWLLLAGATARAQRNDKLLEECRHRFRKPTLRNQINYDGVFPHEVATEFPFRNSLMNFDLLGGCAQVLASPFDDPWSFELDDATSLRSVVAYLYPSLQDRHNWKYLADPQFFRDLPGRRPALLFAARAYNRPDYAATWQAAPAPDFRSLPEPVAASFPISEPLLFTARAPHGL